MGVTFLVYKDAQGWHSAVDGNPKTLPLRKNGQYSVTAWVRATPRGFWPADMFAQWARARWLAVQPDGQPEQKRVCCWWLCPMR